jgi:hypothetical protein
MAKVIVETNPDNDNSQNEALIRLCQERIMQLLVETKDGDDAGILVKLTRAIADLARASVNQKRYPRGGRGQGEERGREGRQDRAPRRPHRGSVEAIRAHPRASRHETARAAGAPRRGREAAPHGRCSWLSAARGTDHEPREGVGEVAPVGASWTDASSRRSMPPRTEAGADALYIGYSEDMTREYIDDCAMWARAYSLAASEVNEFVFEDEDEDWARSAASRRSGSTSRAATRCWRSPRGRARSAASRARSRSTRPLPRRPGRPHQGGDGDADLGRLGAIISSHNGEDNPFNELCRDIEAGKLPYAIHNTTFREAVADGLYQRVCLRRASTGPRPRRSGSRRSTQKYGDNAARSSTASRA